MQKLTDWRCECNRDGRRNVSPARERSWAPSRAQEPMEPPLEDHGATEAAERGLERYSAFGMRLRQLFQVKAKMLAAAGAKAKAAALSNIRYTAYASDVGEGLRPVVPEWAVKASYGIAFAYVGGEVGLHTYHETQKPDGDPARVFVHQSTFHGLASLYLPMVIIHQAVHGAQYAFAKAGRFTKWGPSIVGLSLIPALPFCVDKPVEKVVDFIFEKAWPANARAKGGHQH